MTSAPAAQSDHARLLSGWRYRAVVWSVTIGAICYLGLALWSGRREVAHAVAQVGVSGIAIALSLSLVNYGLRFIRWQAYLRAMEHPVPWWPSLQIYLAGFALTTTPGKAGEALRGVLLKRWGMPYPKSLAAFLSERLSDLLAIMCLASFGVSLYPSAMPLIAAGGVAALTVLLLLANRQALESIERRVSGATRIQSSARQLVQILLQARRCHAPTMLVMSAGLSLLAWTAEAWAFHLILQWMGLEVSLSFAIFVYAASMLAGALSFLPGGLGGSEVAMGGLLIWSGIAEAPAVAATILIRITTLWFAVLLGCFFLAQERKNSTLNRNESE